MRPQQLDALSEPEIEQLFDAGRLSDADMLHLMQTRISPQQLAAIDAIAYGIAKIFHTPIDQLSAEATKIFHTPIDQLSAEAAVHRARFGGPPRLDNLAYGDRKVSDGCFGTYNDPYSGEPPMMNPSVGVDMFERYRDVASDAVRDVRRQAPVLGYYRLGLQQHIYLFPTIQDARSWFDRRGQIPSYDYVAVFLAKNTKVPLLEDFGQTISAAPQVGHWLLPLALGVPAGAYAGYRYRQWQEEHPGKIIPWISGGGDSFVGPGVDPRIVAFRRAASLAVWRKIEADGDYQAPSYLYVDVGGHAHVSGHRSPDEINAHVAVLASRPDFRYAAAFHMGSEGQLQFDAEATPANRVLASGTTVGGPWVDIVGTEPWVDIIGTEPNVGAYPWMSIQDVGPPRFVQRGPWIDIVGTEPWVDIVGTEPWVDIVGADAEAARRRAWYRTRALIQSAIREVTDSDRRGWDVPWGVAAYVWSLNPDGTTSINPLWAPDAALAFLQEVAYTRQPVALALFDKTSPHWPNPVSWTKNPDPAFEGVIAQQVARHGGPRTAGVGALPWFTIVGEALDALRRQAKVAAEGLPGQVIGVRRDGGNRWELKQFRSVDDADDWFGHVTHDPAAYTYAAYFDKADPLYPDPLNEKIGGARARSLPGAPIPRGIAEAS